MVKPYKYYYGQRMILINKKLRGMPHEAFVVSKEEAHLVKMSMHFPYIPGLHDHFFVNAGILEKRWRPAEKGIQTNIFN